MTDEEKQEDAVASARKAGLWVPGQALDRNVGLMAWKMYMAWWEDECRTRQSSWQGNRAKVVQDCVEQYAECIEVAKALEVLNHPEKEQPKELEGGE